MRFLKKKLHINNKCLQDNKEKYLLKKTVKFVLNLAGMHNKVGIKNFQDIDEK